MALEPIPQLPAPNIILPKPPRYVIRIIGTNHRIVYLTPEITWTFDRYAAKMYDDEPTAQFMAKIFEGTVVKI